GSIPASSIFNYAVKKKRRIPFQIYSPHSFRDMLVHLMTEHCKGVEEVRAWSLNLGHESPVTT
ncbi:MAG TPA: recombinase XerC, partial [Deltaproteobacteria bacterium]|nr:recombinase XerC [Deltaproteobacteria bacterium]